jgi:hypothetical protein
MRLPGIFNLGGRNRLPTAEFLLHYEEFKRAKQKAKLEDKANNGNKAEFGDKPFPKSFSASKKGSVDAKKDEKAPDVVTTPDGETFTAGQDATIIELKIQGKTWADIGTEVGKDKHVVSARFREIKPADFGVKEAEWKKNHGGGGGDGGGGKKGKGNPNNQNNQNQQQGGNNNNNNQNNQNQNQNQQQGGKKGNQYNQQNDQNNKNQNKKQGEAQAGAENDAASDAGTWAVADENFTEKEVGVSPSHSFILPFFYLPNLPIHTF